MGDYVRSMPVIVTTKPHADLFSPEVRFPKEALEQIKGHTGIASVEGIDPSPDGKTFGGVRVVFETNEVMDKYIGFFQTIKAQKNPTCGRCSLGRSPRQGGGGRAQGRRPGV